MRTAHMRRALAGFLAKSERESAGYLADESIPATMRDDIRADAETIRNGAALEPDVPITSSATMSLGGRKVQVHLAANAATAGDVWLYDPATQVAIVGDLVTLPEFCQEFLRKWRTRDVLPTDRHCLRRRKFAGLDQLFDKFSALLI